MIFREWSMGKASEKIFVCLHTAYLYTTIPPDFLKIFFLKNH
jgi:hypothetical protein